LIYLIGKINIKSTLFRLMPPDYLHTVLKGPIENAIAWGVSALMAIAHINVVYKENIATLEARVRLLPKVHSLDIWEGSNTRWKHLSTLFKVERDKENKGTSFITGRTEAYNLVPLLTQIV
jgi:hypothetical protein